MAMLQDGKATQITLTVGLVSVLFQCVLIWTGMCEGIIIADDAYYYFTIAGNIVAGRGATFDCMSVTNGYHPLWMLVLLPIFKIFGASLWTPIRMSLSLCAFFNFVSGLVIFNMLRGEGMKTQAVTAAVLWFLSPFTVFLGLRGMESSLSTMLILILFWYMIRMSSGDERVGMKSSVIAGILIGLAGLARTDNLVSMGLTVAIFSVAVLRSRLPSLSRAIGWILSAAFVSLLVVAPWFVWSYVTTGDLMQVSGEVKLLTRTIYGSWPVDWTDMRHAIKSVVYAVGAPIIFPSRFLSGEEFSRMTVRSMSPVIALGLVTGVLLPLLLTFRELIRGPWGAVVRRMFIFVFSYVVIHTALFGLIWRSYAIWYALPYFAFLSVMVGLSLPCLLQRISGARFARHSVVVAVATFYLVVYSLSFTRLNYIPRRPELEYAKILGAISDQYPRGVVVGAFNAGAVGYVAKEFDSVQVTNLDGLVNNRAFEAARKGEYLEYLLQTVDVLIQKPSKASMFLTSADVDSLKAAYTKVPGVYWRKR